MKISYAKKELIYHELYQMAYSGISPIDSAQQLSQRSDSAKDRAFFNRLHRSLKKGNSVPKAFQDVGVGNLELSIIEATHASGHSEIGYKQLSDYYSKLASARRRVISKLAYPAFLLHFGILILAIPKALAEGAIPYFRETLGLLLSAYLITATIIVLGKLLINLATSSSSVESLLHAIPWLGKYFHQSKLMRFTMVFRLQLESGINIMNALQAGANAAQSAKIFRATKSAERRIMKGDTLSDSLVDAAIFPADFRRALTTAEMTGSLDETLQRWELSFTESAFLRLESLSRTIPKLIYIFILLLLGYKIIATYSGVIDQYESILDL